MCLSHPSQLTSLTVLCSTSQSCLDAFVFVHSISLPCVSPPPSLTSITLSPPSHPFLSHPSLSLTPPLSFSFPYLSPSLSPSITLSLCHTLPSLLFLSPSLYLTVYYSFPYSSSLPPSPSLCLTFPLSLRLWLDGVLPMVMDKEASAQEKCISILETIILSNIAPLSNEQLHVYICTCTHVLVYTCTCTCM